VIANDPDADRLAVAIPDATADGGWRRLTGNEIGLLLGWRAARGRPPGGERRGRSPARSCPPRARGRRRALRPRLPRDLTGFKWISRAPGIVYGFEEALGYLVNPETVRDKDGISAAVAMLGMIAEARERGTTLADCSPVRGDVRLLPVRAGVAARRGPVDHRTHHGGAPRRSAARSAPSRSSASTTCCGRRGYPPGDVLRLWLADGSRVIVRPSGTEPKLKAYLDVRGDSADDAAARLAALDEGPHADRRRAG
jgi:phosphomannomutase